MWTRNEKNQSPENISISEQERIDIILRAVADNQVDALENLSKPTDAGGRGWSLNVRHPDGHTPLWIAIKMGHFDLVRRLIAPIEDGGFGLPIEKRELRRLVEGNINLSFYEGGYHRSKPSRKHSFFSLPMEKNDEYRLETYVPASEIDQGSFGEVRLFTAEDDDTRRLVVKRVRQDRFIEKLSSWNIYLLGKNASDEVTFLQRAYPHEGPYKIQHYVLQDGRQYDYRIIMPFVPGKVFKDIVLTVRTLGEFACYFLAIALELQRIHDLGIVHGDARPNNILTDISRDEAGVTYSVHFIDFYNAANVGDNVATFKDERSDIPPELLEKNQKRPVAHPSQDVYTLGYYLNIAAELFSEFLVGRFPSILEFCAACTRENPDERPTMKDFISDIKRDLNALYGDEPQEEIVAQMKCAV